MEMTKKVLASVAALAMLLSACAPKQPATVKIGAIFSITGAAFLGVPEAKTAEMVVEQINASGGLLGRKIELIVKDSGGSPEKALSFAKQLIEENQVFAIIGPSTSGESMQIKDLCEQSKTLLLSAAAAETIVNPVAKHVFKTPQKDSYAVHWIYRTMKDRGITRIAALSSNTGFGQGGMAFLEKFAGEYGIQIAAKEVYDKAATDLTAVLTKVKAANVQAVVNWSIEDAQSIVPKNMRQLGMTIPLFQSHGFGNIKYVEVAGEAAEGIIFPAGRLLVADSLPDNDPQKSLLVKYKADYEARYKEAASTFGGHAYDAILLLSEAVKKAGSLDKEKVRSALENLKGVVGTGGVFNMTPEDHNGLDMDSFHMITVKDGKFTEYKP
jgi:branched-chain amino acid transport system substrate-binding protein